ncbi:deaminase [Geodermatophilus sp. DF01-2]|uniref:dihydrofolate reductase family protein n=1 Tax=Geodermatophilus sp. DF01-2 TaxID=2559610 RepID=UPI001072F3F9|nr:dihydrofolate reductase family protein [Geodermatophilus sp. DF01_2]TFV61232.1 deaminase [Geodermatophilus sp. DF01_2]
MRRLLPGPPADLDDAALVEAYRPPSGSWLRVNFLASLDGATTVAGRSRGLQAPGDLRVFRVLRALADVVLVGAGTAAAEGYRPMRADSPLGRLRMSIGRPPTAPIAVVSRRASLDPASELATGGASRTILVTCASADAGRRAALAAVGVEVLVCGDDDVDLPLARARLAGAGLAQVTCEGGPQLLHATLRAGLDEFDLSIAPALVGSGEIPLLREPLADVVPLQLTQLLEEDGMLFARYLPCAAR